MATETEVEVKTEKVYDLKEGKFIDKPIEKKEVSETKSKEGEENKAEKREAESKKEEKPEEKPEEEKKPEEKVTTPDYNKYLKDKFGVESEDELLKVLDGNKQLTKDLEEAKKPKEYEFKSEKEKAIATFLKDWDMENVGEGIEMAGRLMKMDPEKMNEKIALQEKFVIENSDISRDKAIKLFNNEYNEKYVLLKDKFDTDEEYKEAQELADIKKEKQVAAAKKFLIERKDSLKYKEKAKEEVKQSEKIEIPKETIDKYVGEVNKFFSPAQGEDFDRFIYQDDEDDDIKVTIQFTKEEVQNIKKEATAYLHSTGPYDKDKKIDNFDSGKLVAQIADILYGDQIKERMLKEVKKLAQTLRIEQLAEKKPDKKSGSSEKGKTGILSIDEQFAELGKKAVLDRAKKK